MNEARARSSRLQVSGEPVGDGARGEFVGGEHRGDLRIGAAQLLQLGGSARLACAEVSARLR